MAKLFEPFEVRHIRFENRVVMPPMATDKAADNGSVSKEQCRYYDRMAAAGMGLLIVEHSYIDSEGKASARQTSIARDEDVPLHQKLVHAISGHGVPAALQVNHSGSNRINPPFATGLGASDVPHPGSGITPRQLSPKEISDLVEKFGRAADRASQAGYGLVEVHSAHGFLLSQFLSPLTNRRGDRYGGSLANRCRFLLEVVEQVKGVIAGRMVLLVRLGFSDNPPDLTLFPGGLTPEEGIKVAGALQEAGIDILDLSAGICGSRPKGVSGEAYFLPFAQALRAKVKVPLIITGGVIRPETAEGIITDKSADFVGVGRALAADPEWIRRARQALSR